MSDQSAEIRHQNETIVTFTLVELLTQLVFVAMLLALVLSSEKLKSTGADRIRLLEQQVVERDKKINALSADLKMLRTQLRQAEERVRILLGSKGVTLPFGVHALTQEEFDEFANLKAILEAKQIEMKSLRAKLTGAGGNDKPNCIVTPSFLIAVDVLQDGNFRVQQAWNPGSQVDKIPGLRSMVAEGIVSKTAFRKYGTQINKWALKQEVPCAFKAVVRLKHNNATLFNNQLHTIEQSFYVARR